MPLSRLFSEASVGTLFLEELSGHNLLENNVFCTIPGIHRQVNLKESGRRFSPGLLRLPDTRFAEAFTEFLLNCRHGNITMSHGHDGVKEQIRHLVI